MTCPPILPICLVNFRWDPAIGHLSLLLGAVRMLLDLILLDLLMLGPTNCFPHSIVTRQIWHPGKFSIPLAVVDSIVEFAFLLTKEMK